MSDQTEPVRKGGVMVHGMSSWYSQEIGQTIGFREVKNALRDMTRRTALILLVIILAVYGVLLLIVGPSNNWHSGSGNGGETIEPSKSLQER